MGGDLESAGERTLIAMHFSFFFFFFLNQSAPDTRRTLPKLEAGLQMPPSTSVEEAFKVDNSRGMVEELIEIRDRPKDTVVLIHPPSRGHPQRFQRQDHQQEIATLQVCLLLEGGTLEKKGCLEHSLWNALATPAAC